MATTKGTTMSLLQALILLRNATAVVGAIGNVLGDLHGFESGELTADQIQELNAKIEEIHQSQKQAENAWADLAPSPSS